MILKLFNSTCLLSMLLSSAAPMSAQSAIPAADHEDWTALSLAGKPLPAEKPVVGEIDDFPTFTRQMIEVQWRVGDPIYLYVMLPKLVAKPPVVIYLNDYKTDSQLFLNNDYGKLLTSNGVAAVGFAPALSGQRYHDRPMLQWFVSELQESLGETVHDVQMVLNYLASRGDLDMERLAVVGDGSGGPVAVMAAAVDSRIKALDLLDPWGDWPDWLAKSTVVPDEERANFLKPDFLAKVAPLDTVKFLPALKIPIRLQYLRKDGATPAKAADSVKAAAPSQTVSIPQDQALAEYRASEGKKFLDWIKNQLLGQKAN